MSIVEWSGAKGRRRKRVMVVVSDVDGDDREIANSDGGDGDSSGLWH